MNIANRIIAGERQAITNHFFAFFWSFLNTHCFFSGSCLLPSALVKFVTQIVISHFYHGYFCCFFPSFPRFARPIASLSFPILLMRFPYVRASSSSFFVSKNSFLSPFLFIHCRKSLSFLVVGSVACQLFFSLGKWPELYHPCKNALFFFIVDHNLVPA